MSPCPRHSFERLLLQSRLAASPENQMGQAQPPDIRLEPLYRELQPRPHMDLRRSLSSRRRRGLTEFVVTVFLIIVALITGTILAGIAFGAMGIYSGSAAVSAQVASCGPTGSAEVCQINLTNQGSSTVYTGGSCNLGPGHPGAVQNGGVVPAGGSLHGVSCVVPGVAPASGSPITGSISLTDGFVVFFSGTAT